MHALPWNQQAAGVTPGPGLQGRRAQEWEALGTGCVKGGAARPCVGSDMVWGEGHGDLRL